MPSGANRPRRNSRRPCSLRQALPRRACQAGQLRGEKRRHIHGGLAALGLGSEAFPHRIAIAQIANRVAELPVVGAKQLLAGAGRDLTLVGVSEQENDGAGRVVFGDRLLECFVQAALHVMPTPAVFAGRIRHVVHELRARLGIDLGEPLLAAH